MTVKPTKKTVVFIIFGSLLLIFLILVLYLVLLEDGSDLNDVTTKKRNTQRNDDIINLGHALNWSIASNNFHLPPRTTFEFYVLPKAGLIHYQPEVVADAAIEPECNSEVTELSDGECSKEPDGILDTGDDGSYKVGSVGLIVEARHLDSLEDGSRRIAYEEQITESFPIANTLIEVDEIHIWGGRRCVSDVITGARYTGVNAEVEKSDLRASVAFVYRLEGSADARCKDNQDER